MAYIYDLTDGNYHYVGQTASTLKRRLSLHRSDAKKKESFIYRVMRKYGPRKFKIKVIEKIPESQLNDREVYWIAFYKDKYGPKCCNITPGGEGAGSGEDNPQSILTKSDVLCIKADKLNGLRNSELARAYRCSEATICDILKGRTWKGLGFVDYENHEPNYYTFPFGQYESCTEICRDFEKHTDVKVVAKKYGMKPKHVRQHLRREMRRLSNA